MTSSYWNEWLDEYNDYMRLYEFFGDAQYLEEAREILHSLKALVIRQENHRRIVYKIMSDQLHAYK
ncbi:hypothetical protein D3C73_781920 [compost metagenome]